MPIKYNTIFNAVALRAGLFKDGNVAAIESAYQNADLSAKIDSVEIPYSALRADVLRAEKDIAAMIANSNNSFYKAKLGTGRSAEITPITDSLPAETADGKEFIGALSGVFDAETNRPLVEKTKAEIYRFLSPESLKPFPFFTIPVYYFAFDGDRVLATVQKVYLTGTVFDAQARETAFDAENGESILPSEFENFWICKTLASLAQEGFFIAEAQTYAGRAQEMAADLIGGRAQTRNLPQIPTKQASADERD